MVAIASDPKDMASPGMSVADEARLYRKIGWRLIPFLMLCYAVAYLDRVNIGFAKLGMSSDLRLSETVYGLGAGIFFIGYFLCEVPSNMMLHKLGARIWIARIMISWGILSAACSLISGPISFYVLRFLLGIAEAGFFPGIILYLTYWFPTARRGQVIALFMIAIPLAGLVGGPLSGAVMVLGDGWLGRSGWRWMFILEAVPAIVLGLMIPFMLDSRVADARWLNDVEKKVIADALERDGTATRHVHAGLRDIAADPVIRRFAAIYFCCIMGQYGVTFWLPTMLAKVGSGSALTVGIFSVLPYGCAVIAMVLVCRHSDATGERRWHLVLPMLIGGIGLILAPGLAGSVAFSLMLFCIAAAATLTATPMFWTLPTAALSGPAAAVGIAAINSVGNIAGFVSPLLIGWVSDRTGSIVAGMAALAAILAIGAILTLTAPRETVPL
jgi:MFS family permease